MALALPQSAAGKSYRGACCGLQGISEGGHSEGASLTTATICFGPEFSTSSATPHETASGQVEDGNPSPMRECISETVRTRLAVPRSLSEGGVVREVLDDPIKDDPHGFLNRSRRARDGLASHDLPAALHLCSAEHLARPSRRMEAQQRSASDVFEADVLAP
jgi:hypothetical protein